VSRKSVMIRGGGVRLLTGEVEAHIVIQGLNEDECRKIMELVRAPIRGAVRAVTGIDVKDAAPIGHYHRGNQ
jgi:hypothetical protein